jgi:glutamate 5-kinase
MTDQNHENSPISDRRMKLAKARRVVVKIGTSTITFSNGRLNLANLEYLCRSIANQMNQGRQIILVSSGAIGVGVGRLRLPGKPRAMREKQAVAAVGQCELMSMYSRLFSDFNYVVGQILLTKDDIDDETTRRNICNTFEALIEKEIIPVVNENDTVSTIEIYHNGTFGDNDTLSAMVAEMTQADLLIILSDIDGLYDCDPRTNESAHLISSVTDINGEIELSAGSGGSNRGTGGMQSKVAAARIAVAAGVDTVIANGSTQHVIDLILEGQEIGTLFVTGSRP